jgi:hypothetical protein
MKLIIQSTAYQKIRAYTDICPKEISGLGKVEMIDGKLTVTDVTIFEQTVSASHSTIPPEALAKFQNDMVKKGGSMKQWCLWWHSHAEMGVFFSGTDTNTIDSSTEFPYLVSLVVNKKGDSKARIDVYQPVHMFSDLEVEVKEADEPEVLRKAREAYEKALDESKTKIKDSCEKQIKDKVRGLESSYREVGYQDRLPMGRRDDVQYPSNWDDRHSGDMELDREIEVEYWNQKVFLLKAISTLKKKGHKGSRELTRAEEELKNHIIWGKSMGLEVTRHHQQW